MEDSKDPCNFVSVEAELNPESIRQWLSIVKNGKKTDKGTRRSDISTKVKKHLSALGWVFAYYPRRNKRELRYKSPNGRWFYSLATACLSCVDHEDDSTQQQQQQQILSKSDSSCSPIKLSLVEDVSKKTRKKRKRLEDCYVNRSVPNNEETLSCASVKILPNVDVSKKKRAKDCDTAAFHANEEKNRSSDLMNVDVINQQVKKRTRQTAAALDKGEERPSFGKSLRNILQVMEKKNKMCEKESVRFWRKDCGPEKNCDVCCVCHYGGELLLCDGCPSAFHHTCLGLLSIPEEKLWFCPCCCCDICGSMETSGNSKLMTCEQCQRRFHLKCLKQVPCLVSCRGWFCSSQCSRVFNALQGLLGRKIAVGDEDLVWTLMRAPNDEEHYDDEQISKLDSAVEILHQGFEPSKDPFSGRDLVEELIFRKDATGVGRGFYTVLIERKNEPITVAAMRVDKDVAEIPLVSTLPHYRRSGMCRVLMDELEKQLSRMGVCRLVLPAAADVVNTWTQRFGFSVMESWERLELVKHGMLDFVGTVMCHKFLMHREDSRESSLTD
ncbi:hypothetical protein EUTSA_v10005427mg [Eutrema salsugineum]|uniref:PHD-type domain-containing protein n=1 Tax=Eutrema salsugineum TaxID=72664 RepID=V4MJI8_EUTSA|nr:increased DNA methylation 1 [Eutrema salsugineum]ESQ31516.1 hypothetical protein EUTSA_v10005427mg [Eutrema salsugineum]